MLSAAVLKFCTSQVCHIVFDFEGHSHNKLGAINKLDAQTLELPQKQWYY